MVIIGEQLRHAREIQGRSIEDISAVTRINRKFLDDLEHGRIPNLPMTYVRALIKSYAQEVGLDGIELLKCIDQPQPETEAVVDGHSSAVETPVSSPIEGAMSNGGEPEKGKRHQGKVLVLLSILLLMGFVISIVWLKREREVQPARETSFSEVIKEQESKFTPRAQMADSLPPKRPGIKNAPRPDSLTLEGIASDTVWVHMVIDSAKTTEHTLPPLYRMHWKAKKSFLVSVGNAAGVSFTLNGYKLGQLGTSRKPVKNVALSFENLAKLNQAKEQTHDGQH
ncbi:MAG: DUF4115 domain-containing protein [Ignavibacteria bacterium]|nr:DUF4115 domain-containing protein [Ignavibacteria bacterium]MBI3765586.1 DUF4115 domain-containing protein [Ignavibacteriales bacterium]